MRVLYVSPLKALVYDIERNLRAPLVGVRRAAERLGEAAALAARRGAHRRHAGEGARRPGARPRRDPRHDARVALPDPRLGAARDAAQRRDGDRRRDPRARADASAARTSRCRSSASPRSPRAIRSASASRRPRARSARSRASWAATGPSRSSTRSAPPELDLEIRVPVADMTRPIPVRRARRRRRRSAPATPTPAARARSSASSRRASCPTRRSASGRRSMPSCSRDVRAHRSTIVFVNSRGLCERLAQRLNELAGEELVRAHHGSIAHEQRREIEEALKAGRLRGIVATSSLELGIDMGAVDLVLLVESPGAVSRGLQRVGRAGHSAWARSRTARIYPKHRGDLLEATRRRAAACEAGAVEALRVPRNPLDVLAQQIVAMVGVEPWTVARPRAHGAARRALPRALARGAGRRARHALRPLSLDRVRRAAPAPRLGPRERRAARAAGRGEARARLGRHDPRPRPLRRARRRGTARASASSTRRWSTRRAPGRR